MVFWCFYLRLGVSAHLAPVPIVLPPIYYIHIKRERYIYIQRERERERERGMCVYVYICMYVYTLMIGVKS